MAANEGARELMTEAANVIERLGGPMRTCTNCGRRFDVRGKEHLTVYQLAPEPLIRPVASYCSDECADKH